MSDKPLEDKEIDALEQMGDAAETSKLFLQSLEQTGFFRQIGDLEGNLKKIAGDLKLLGDATLSRMQEVENLVAHVLAIECVLSVLVKEKGVDIETVRAEVRRRTAEQSGQAEGSPAVNAVIADLFG